VIWWQHEQDLNRIQDLGDDSADQPGTGIGLPLKKLRAEQGKIHEDQTGGREISEKQAAATPKTEAGRRTCLRSSHDNEEQVNPVGSHEQRPQKKTSDRWLQNQHGMELSMKSETELEVAKRENRSRNQGPKPAVRHQGRRLPNPSRARRKNRPAIMKLGVHTCRALEELSGNQNLWWRHRKQRAGKGIQKQKSVCRNSDRQRKTRRMRAAVRATRAHTGAQNSPPTKRNEIQSRTSRGTKKS
jgi:hypothetical protein